MSKGKYVERLKDERSKVYEYIVEQLGSDSLIDIVLEMAYDAGWWDRYREELEVIRARADETERRIAEGKV